MGRAGGESAIEARVWLDRGVDAVLQPGDRARVYYRTAEDAFIALFQVDTEGVVRLLLPTHPDEANHVRGGRDYRLLFPEAPDWLVSDAPGVGYFFIVASRTPFDFNRLTRVPQTGEWNLSRTGARIRQDPYVAIDGFTGVLLPGRGADGFGLDFTGYHVGQTYSYPRFLCYECHVPQAYEAWNPYRQACTHARIVIYNDPYFYPASRYQGNRTAYPRPPVPGQPQFGFKEREPGEPGTPLVQGRPPAGVQVTLFAEGGRAQEVEFLRRMIEVGVLTAAQGDREGAPLPGTADATVPPPSRSLPGSVPPAPPLDERPVLQRRSNP